jgi:hypothetical protein
VISSIGSFLLEHISLKHFHLRSAVSFQNHSRGILASSGRDLTICLMRITLRSPSLLEPSVTSIHNFNLHTVALKLQLINKARGSEYNANVLEDSLNADYEFDFPKNARTIVSENAPAQQLYEIWFWALGKYTITAKTIIDVDIYDNSFDYFVPHIWDVRQKIAEGRATAAIAAAAPPVNSLKPEQQKGDAAHEFNLDDDVVVEILPPC